MKLAFQGVPGAYSDLACQTFVPDATPVSFDLAQNVFEAVKTGEVDAGLIPIENSIAGQVTTSFDLFLDYDFFITREFFLPIRHALLGVKGSKLSDLTHVHSHPIALAQCRKWTGKQGLKEGVYFDTAGAAKWISENGDPTKAAIASVNAAKSYDLEVLAQDIQDWPNNFTRFLLFQRTDLVPDDIVMEKTTLIFQTKHHPGALLGSLRRFSENKINLSAINSRPIPENPFEYFFYIDIEGGMRDANVRSALVDLNFDAKGIKILGSYKKGQIQDS